MAFGSRLFGAVLLIGAGAVAVTAVVAAPVILRRARPLVREGFKRGIDLYERARTAAADACNVRGKHAGAACRALRRATLARRARSLYLAPALAAFGAENPRRPNIYLARRRDRALHRA